MIEVGIQNSAMAIVIASALMQSDQAALPAAFYSFTMYLFGFGVVLWRQRRVVSTGPEPAAKQPVS